MTLPYWLKLVRSGSSFSAYQSTNGTSWTQVGSTTTITMTDPIYVGLQINNNGDNSTLCSATFDNVTVTQP